MADLQVRLGSEVLELLHSGWMQAQVLPWLALQPPLEAFAADTRGLCGRSLAAARPTATK
jgi:hypothetical protein